MLTSCNKDAGGQGRPWIELFSLRRSFEGIAQIDARNAELHFRRLLLDQSTSAALHRGERRKVFEQTCASGVIFNLERLIHAGAAQNRFACFRPVYECLDQVALRSAVLSHYRNVDSQFGAVLEELMASEPEEFLGMRARSLANTLFHARQLTACVYSQPRVLHFGDDCTRRRGRCCWTNWRERTCRQLSSDSLMS